MELGVPKERRAPGERLVSGWALALRSVVEDPGTGCPRTCNGAPRWSAWPAMAVALASGRSTIDSPFEESWRRSRGWVLISYSAKSCSGARTSWDFGARSSREELGAFRPRGVPRGALNRGPRTSIRCCLQGSSVGSGFDGGPRWHTDRRGCSCALEHSGQKEAGSDPTVRSIRPIRSRGPRPPAARAGASRRARPALEANERSPGAVAEPARWSQREEGPDRLLWPHRHGARTAKVPLDGGGSASPSRARFDPGALRSPAGRAEEIRAGVGLQAGKTPERKQRLQPVRTRRVGGRTPGGAREGTKVQRPASSRCGASCRKRILE